MAELILLTVSFMAGVLIGSYLQYLDDRVEP